MSIHLNARRHCPLEAGKEHNTKDDSLITLYKALSGMTGYILTEYILCVSDANSAVGKDNPCRPVVSLGPSAAVVGQNKSRAAMHDGQHYVIASPWCE